MIKHKRLLLAPVLLLACGTAANADAGSAETLYAEALECRLAAQSVLLASRKSEPQNEEEADALAYVENTESFYNKLSLFLGRKLGKRDPIIGLDYARLQLDLTQTILRSPDTMADMVTKTKACGEAYLEAEKA
ncbi:MAG: hypothetical protein ACFCUS_11085 [Rubrimonas sp.]